MSEIADLTPNDAEGFEDFDPEYDSADLDPDDEVDSEEEPEEDGSEEIDDEPLHG